MPKKHFIKSAIKRPGAFKRKARKAGMTTRAFAQAKKHAKGLLGKEARFDLTLAKLRKHKKKVV